MRKKVTCPETGHLEEIEVTNDPIDGHIVGVDDCTRWCREYLDCPQTCAHRLNKRLPNIMKRERAWTTANYYTQGPGRDRVKLAPAHEIAAMLLTEVLADLRPAPGSRLLVMLSGLGGTPDAELYLLYGEVAAGLRAAGLRPERVLVGNLVTSLEQQGAALTLLELDDAMLALWDAPVRTAALRWGM